jgi:hypothetical protein
MFQKTAFQNDAFQVVTHTSALTESAAAPTPTLNVSGSTTVVAITFAATAVVLSGEVPPPTLYGTVSVPGGGVPGLKPFVFSSADRAVQLFSSHALTLPVG